MPISAVPSRWVVVVWTVVVLLVARFCPSAFCADDKSTAPAEKKESTRFSNGTPLDATPAEVSKFYGPVWRENARVRNHQILDGTVFDGNLYSKNGLIIRVVYIKGRSVLLEYTRALGPLTLTDVNLLLTDNASNSTWQAGKDSNDTNKFYRRLDDKAIAHWSTQNDGSLLVSVEDGPAFGDGLIH